MYLFENELSEQNGYLQRETDGLFYSINLADYLDLSHVPIVENQVRLTKDLIDKYSSQMNIDFGEGVVIQHDHGSFKIINKNYDAKN